MLAVCVQFQQIAVELGRGVAVHLSAFHDEASVSHFPACLLYGGRPEGVEVGRVLRIGLQLFGREAYLYVMLIGMPLNACLQSEVQESGLLHGTHVDDGPSVLKHHLATLCGRKHVGSNLITDFHILRDAVLAESHLYLGSFAGLVKPVGMVGNRQPQVVAAVRIILSGNE